MDVEGRTLSSGNAKSDVLHGTLGLEHARFDVGDGMFGKKGAVFGGGGQRLRV